MTRQISQVGIDFIKQWEGFRSEPYLDVAGVPTQGYGTTDGITMDSEPIDEQTAEGYMKDDLSKFELAVEDYISAELNDNQFAALVSLCYNTGTSPLKMTMGKLLNSRQFDAAANEFLKWDHSHVNGKLVEIAGLKDRRIAERKLFITPV